MTAFNRKRGLKLALGAMALFAAAGIARADDAPVAQQIDGETDMFLGIKPDAKKGYELMMSEPMAVSIMKTADVDRLHAVWEPEEQAKYEAAATPLEKRKLVYERYGWAARPGEDETALPLDYTDDHQGNLVTNCFSCHGGKVAGVTIPGAGNTHIDLTSLATDVTRLGALDHGRDPNAVQEAKIPFNTPLNFHKGFTNAVIFAPVFMALRDPVYRKELMANPEYLMHHDMNPPAWWNFKKKSMIYCDGFAPKTPRQLMPFAMSPTFNDEKFHSFEPNFVHIFQYIEELQPPKYPYAIDAALAKQGEELFTQTCSKCHGTYGPDGKFPNKVIDIKKIGTDDTRWQSLRRKDREKTNEGWLQYHGKHPILNETPGYLAQPLDGIWASAPYFHNGAAPTLTAVMNPTERPKVWKRTENGYDQKNVGLEVETLAAVPEGLSSRQARYYYDTTHVGNSNAGHTFPDELTANEKVAVIEYLKTL